MLNENRLKSITQQGQDKKIDFGPCIHKQENCRSPYARLNSIDGTEQQ